MSNIFRRLLTRVIIFERATGNILDLPARRVLSSEVPEVSEERVQTTPGTTRARRRDHSVQLRIIGREESQLARIMADSCAVGMVAIGRPGTRHLFWQEDAILSRVPGAAAALQHADDVVSLESGVFNPAIWGGDLIAGVPWEGTTAGKTGSFARLDQRDISDTAAVDLGRGHDGKIKLVREDDAVRDAFGNGIFGSDSAFSQGIDWDGSNYIIADADAAGPFIHRTDSSGAERSGSPYAYAGQVPRSLAYYRPADLCYVVDKDEDQVYVLDGSGSFSQLRTVVPQNSADPLAVAIDGDQLLVSTLAGTVQVWSIPDTSGGEEAFVQEIGGGTAIGNPWAGTVQSWNGMVVQDGVLYGYETGESAADVATRYQLGPVSGQDHDGSHWRVQSGASADITGQPSGVDGDTPAVLQTTLPAIGATVRLDNVTGELQLVDWNGTVQNANQSDQIGQSPEVTLESSKYAGLGISTSQIWRLIATVDSAAARPELRVVDPGEALGARPGGTVSDCQTRVSSPAWGSVAAIAFDVDADSDDQLQITVVDAVGNYVGQISGDGESVQGTSAIFTYESAGVYTAELVAQTDFDGVTEVGFALPVQTDSDGNQISDGALLDLDTLDLSAMEDVVEFRANNGRFKEEQFTGEMKGPRMPPNLEVLRKQGVNCVWDLGELPDSMRILKGKHSVHTGDLGNMPAMEVVEIESSDGTTSGTIDAEQGGDQLKVLKAFFFSSTPGTVDVSLSSGIPKNSPNLQNYLSSQNDGDIRDMFEGCRNLVKWKIRFASLSPNAQLDGQINGNPVLPQSLETFEAGSVKSIERPPDDFSQSSNLRVIRLYRSTSTYTKPYLSNTINDLYANRSTVPLNTLGVVERTARSSGVNFWGGSKSATALRKMAGLGPYHPDNGGEGLLDVGVSISDYCLLRKELIAVDTQAQTLTFEVGNPIVTSNGTDYPKFEIQNGRLNVRNESTGSKWRPYVSSAIAEDRELRVFASDGTDKGHFKIADDSAQSFDDDGDGTIDRFEVTVSIDTGAGSSFRTDLSNGGNSDNAVAAGDDVLFYNQWDNYS